MVVVLESRCRAVRQPYSVVAIKHDVVVPFEASSEQTLVPLMVLIARGKVLPAHVEGGK